MWKHAPLSSLILVVICAGPAKADANPDLPPPEQAISFMYGGKSSHELLPAWRKEHQATKDGIEVTTITDPKTGLQIRCETRRFADFTSAVESVFYLENTGQADTPLIKNILPLDVSLTVDGDANPIFHYNKGSTVGPANDDFIPKHLELKEKASIDLPVDKIPSQASLPYFNLQTKTGGIIGAIGWTGQWALHVDRDGNRVKLRAGQQLTHLVLHHGEKIRTPRMLMLEWKGSDPLVGHNQFRRLLVAHYLPRIDGEIVTPKACIQDCITGLLVPPANEQMQDIDRMAKLGGEAYWLDASWFPGDFRFDVGSWIVRADLFPEGLRPISDRTRKNGMKFLLWIEPERIGGPNTMIAREHPQWCLSKREPWLDPETNWPGHPSEMLFDLGNPDARKWMTDFLSQKIDEWGVDVLRQDRNFHPVRYWRAADAPDRQGMRENLYVQGFYAMWDELRQRHPKLIIDSCNWRNTGPDFEVLTRAAGAWSRSEIAECGRLPVPNQVQVAGLSLYVPIHANGIFSLDPYQLRSVSIQGGTMQIRQTDLLADGKHDELAMKAIAEIKRLRPLTLGDFYPLTPIDLDETHWSAWQFDRPEIGQGFATFLRRPKSAEADLIANLHGLDFSAEYDVQISPTYELGPTQRMTGKSLAKLKVQIPATEQSVVVTYQRAK